MGFFLYKKKKKMSYSYKQYYCGIQARSQQGSWLKVALFHYAKIQATGNQPSVAIHLKIHQSSSQVTKFTTFIN